MKRLSSFLVVLLLFCHYHVKAQTGNLQHDGLVRTYWVHEPANVNPDSSYALIVALHGGFGSGEQLERQSELSEKADQAGFFVVYPDGVKSPLGIRTWNGGACCGYAVNEAVDDVGFIEALIEKISVENPIDPNRIYATGISNGAYMSYRLACELSDKIAGIAPVAGSMNLPACNPSDPVPIIHFHSYQDDNIPYQGGVGNGPSKHYNPPLDSVLNAWGTHNGCTAQDVLIHEDALYTHRAWQNCDCAYEQHLYISQDGGHSWPGGIKTTIGDATSETLQANDLMWAFFQQHSKNCVVSIQENLRKKNVQLYPNPARDMLYIDIKNQTKKCSISITDVQGKVCVLLDQHDTQDPIKINHLHKGLYFIKCYSSEFYSDNVKFIKI